MERDDDSIQVDNQAEQFKSTKKADSSFEDMMDRDEDEAQSKVGDDRESFDDANDRDEIEMDEMMTATDQARRKSQRLKLFMSKGDGYEEEEKDKVGNMLMLPGQKSLSSF
jgi:hypothetical protein